MSSFVTRRTVVRESTISKRRTSDRYSSEEKENPAAYRRYSASQANLPAFMEEDYFESGSYRPDRIGKPWRSPNLSRRSIHSSYSECESMRKRQSKTTYSESVSSTTPANSQRARVPCQHSGGTGGVCDHTDCCLISQSTEKQHASTTKVMHELWNTNHNNSMPYAMKLSNGRPSAVSRVSVWRAATDGATTSSDAAGVTVEKSSDRNGDRRESKKVSSMYGLDEANEGRITRSRSKRLDAASNHVNSVAAASSMSSNASNSSAAVEDVNNSNSGGITLYWWHTKCLVDWLAGLLARLREECGAPHVLLIPVYLLAMLITYMACLPFRLGRSILTALGVYSDARSESADELVERQEGGKRRGIAGWCWPCVFILIPLLVLLVFLLWGFGGVREQRSSAADFGRQTWVTVRDFACHAAGNGLHFARSAWRATTGFLDCIFRGIVYVLTYVIQYIICGVKYLAFSPLVVLDFVKTTAVSTKDYILMVIRSEAEAEVTRDQLMKRERPKKTVIPPVADQRAGVVGMVSDEQFSALLARIEEHDGRLRVQEKDLQQQRKKIDEMLTSLSNSEKKSNELRLLIANWENEMRAVKSRAQQVDGILNQLKEFRKQLAKTDQSLILELANRQKDAAGKELEALRALVEDLRTAVERDGAAVKAALGRHEEALQALSVKAASAATGGGTKKAPAAVAAVADAELRRLVAQVTSGHQRLAELEAHRTKLGDTLAAVKAEQQRLAAQQTACDERVAQVAATVDTKTAAAHLRSVCAGAVTSQAAGGVVGGRAAGGVQAMIDAAIARFAADRIARPDFALESAGGSIIGTRCTQTYTDRPAVFSLFGVPLFRLSRSPRSVIQPAVQPGECWAFRGAQGQVVVRLANDIAVTAVTLEHIPTALAPNGKIESAPRHIHVYGLQSEADYKGWLLGKFEYRADGPPLQTFDISPPAATGEEDKEEEERRRKRPAAFRYVEMKVLSNHGHKEYTCVYRLRVHGNLVDANAST